MTSSKLGIWQRWQSSKVTYTSFTLYIINRMYKFIFSKVASGFYFLSLYSGGFFVFGFLLCFNDEMRQKTTTGEVGPDAR